MAYNYINEINVNTKIIIGNNKINLNRTIKYVLKITKHNIQYDYTIKLFSPMMYSC